MTFVFQSEAFAKKNTVKLGSSKSVRAFETRDWMVLFSVSSEGFSKRKKGDIRWSEMTYKLVDRSDPPGKLFGDSETAEIRFQDREGFNLAAVRARREHSKTEYYGFLRIEQAKARQIRKVEVLPLKSEPAAEPPPALPASENKKTEPLPSAQVISPPSAKKPEGPAGLAAHSEVYTIEKVQKTLADFEKKSSSQENQSNGVNKGGK